MLFDFESRINVYSVVLFRDGKLLLEWRNWIGGTYLGLPTKGARFGERLEALVERAVGHLITIAGFRRAVCVSVRTLHPASGADLMWGLPQRLATYHLLRIENPHISASDGGVWWDMREENPHPDASFSIFQDTGELDRLRVAA